MVAILRGWQEYNRVYFKYAADPTATSDFSEVALVTVDGQVSHLLSRISSLREKKLAVVGGQVYRNVSVSPVSKDGQGRATAQITYCSDANELVVVDVETGDRVPRSGTVFEKTTMVQGEDAKWRVADIENEAKTC